MVEMIRVLINRGHAYEAGGEVLFSVGSMADYGKLSGRKLEDQQAGARVAVDAHKKNPGDFVLWKQSSAEEPGWDSPWGRGRPGWHIECSVMSKAHLGEVFDIHGGGLDLIFPHHENEIAQSRCAHGTEAMARYWMHNGFLQVEGKKMSKSDGNFVTIADVLNDESFGGKRWYGPVVRLAMLKTHYRQPIDWTVRALEEAESNLKSLSASYLYPNIEQPFESVFEQYVSRLADDLNFSSAFALLMEEAPALDPKEIARLLDLVGVDIELFVLQEKHSKTKTLGEDDRQIVLTLINARLAARKAKNWAESDRFRDELLAKGIQIKDVKDPVTGEMQTEWEVKR
jgi:cysteinyl-tRNA synthetase